MGYKINITEENFNKVNERGADQNSSSEKRKQIEKQLEELRSIKKPDVDKIVRESYGLKSVAEDGRTDEELKQLASGEAALKREEQLKQLEAQAKDKRAELEDDIKEQKAAAEVDKQHIQSTYEQAKNRASSEALKRGIARSSIIFNMLKDYDQQKQDRIYEVDDKATQRISSLESEISDLDDKLKQAVKDLDMKTAYEINERLNELKSERDKKNLEAIKHNNEVNEKLNEYKEKFLSSAQGKQLQAEANERWQQKNRDVTLQLLDYYDGLSVGEIVEDYLSGNYGEYLSEQSMKLIEAYISARQGK